MPHPKSTARSFIDTDLHYAIGRVDNAVALLSDAELSSSKLRSELKKAREALTAAQRMTSGR